MAKKPFKPGYGTHKFGSDYWPGAQPDADEIVERLQDGTSVSVFGLRRIGKSSLIAETRERLRAAGKTVLWIDLQKHDTLASTLAALLKELAENDGPVAKIETWANNTDLIPVRIRAKVTSLIKSKVDSLADSDVDAYAEVLFDQIGNEFAALAPEKRPVIIFDELPLLFLNAIKQTEPPKQPKVVARMNKFLAILRHWRSDDVGVSMALSGSFSMPWLRREYGIDDEHINDCDPIVVEEMNEDEARKLLEACIAAKKPKGWEEACTDTLLALLPAYYPGVVQLAYSKIKYAKDASLASINGGLKDKVEHALEEKYYIQFDRRFARYGGNERKRAAKLFKEIARTKDNVVEFDDAIRILSKNDTEEDDQDGRELLDFLQSDGFITSSRTKGISYTSGLVSAWRSD